MTATRALCVIAALTAGIGIGLHLRTEPVDGADLKAIQTDRATDADGTAPAEAAPSAATEVGADERRIRIDVRLADETQPAVARIVITSDEDQRTVTWTPHSGPVRVGRGDMDIHALIGAQRTPAIFVGADDQPEEICLRVPNRPGIRGKVHLPDGWRLPRLTVRVGRADRYTDGSDLSGLTHAARVKRSDDYSFEFFDLAPGSYVIAASIDGKRAQGHAHVEVQQTIVDQDVVVEKIEHPRYRPVQVLGPDGQGVTGAQFGLNVTGPDGSAGLAGGAIEFEQGRYLMLCPDAINQPGVRCTLRVISREFGDKTVPYEAADKTLRVIRLSAPGTVEVTIEEFEASAVSAFLQVRYRVAGSKRPARAVRGATIDVNGVLRMGAIQPGEIEFLLGIEHDHTFAPIARKLVKLHPGPNEIRFGIPKLYALRVISAEHKQAATIGLNLVNPSALAGRRHVEFPGVGELVIDRLPAGTYEVVGHTQEQTWKRTVTVPTDRELRIP